ncbi:MAG TPA: anthranilate synthase component I, partial [Microthrixaceae bacterium]|nr:anthranilate synthase component I [Microthrixaceae bacterium]
MSEDGEIGGVIPGRDEFRAAARRATVVPVRRELLADQVTPVAVFGRLCGVGEGANESGFLLESVGTAGRWNRWSFVGRSPRARLVCRGGEITVTGDLPDGLDLSDGVLAVVEQLLERYRAEEDDTLPPLHSGIVGYLGYDVVREVEHLPGVPNDDRGWPDAVLSLIGDLVALDHWSQRALLISNVYVPEGASDADLDALYDEAVARIDAMAADGTTPLDEPMVSPPSKSDELPAVESSMPPGQYESAV